MATPRRPSATRPDGRPSGRPSTAVTTALGVLSVLLASAVLLAACGGSSTTTPLGTGTTPTSRAAGAATPSGAAAVPPAVPAQGAYLGAWVHPSPTSTEGAFAEEQSALPDVLAATGRPLGLLHVYAPWARPAPVAQLRDVVADGSVPVLDWGCGPDVAQLAGGEDDGLITAYAEALKRFQGPVFLRWCWEMNLVGTHPQVGGPSGFTGAWDHIRALFRSAGATNVSFVWCPALTGVDPAPYFPGASEVDWIGVDGYDRSGTQTFASLFGAFVRTWQAQGKPLMVGETGSSGSNQATFIASIGTDAPTLPSVKAVAYFDAPGPLNDWQFTPAGLQAFGHLAALAYFHPA